MVRLDPDLPLPSYAKPGDAGVDLRAREGTRRSRPGAAGPSCPTGSPSRIPEGYAGFVQPRSGLARGTASRASTRPASSTAGYRDELKVLLVNTDPTEPFEVERGERIAQLVIQRHEHVAFVEVDELDDSERGDGGFGHTGR